MSNSDVVTGSVVELSVRSFTHGCTVDYRCDGAFRSVGLSDF